MHEIKQINTRQDGELEVICTCGAYWTHLKGTSKEKVDLMMDAHRKYAEREPLKTL